MALPLVAAGITTVIANYELCPASTLDGVAESAIAAVDWVRREASSFGGDPRRISLSGHSAGAHLTAECMAHDWAAAGIDPTFIIGAVMISGIYNPRPVMGTSVNAEVRLTEDVAVRRDVERRPVRQLPDDAVRRRPRALALDRANLPLFAPSSSQPPQSRSPHAAALGTFRYPE